MPSTFIRNELPKTRARQRWAVTLKVGLDVADIVGLGTAFAESAAAATSLIQNNLQTFGSVENFEIVQGRSLHERYALGQNSSQPFQVTPLSTNTQIRLSRIQLKFMENAQRVFNFFPNNLLHQQLPFIIEAIDPGDGENISTQVIHYFFSCWFTESNIKYDVISREDQRLIQTATVRSGQTLTLDNSIGGNPIATLGQNIISGVIVSGAPKKLIENLSFL